MTKMVDMLTFENNKLLDTRILEQNMVMLTIIAPGNSLPRLEMK